MSNLPAKKTPDEEAEKELYSVSLRLKNLSEAEQVLTKTINLTDPSSLQQFIVEAAAGVAQAVLTKKDNEYSRWVSSNCIEALIVTSSKLYDGLYTQIYTRKKRQQNLDNMVTALIEIGMSDIEKAKDRIEALRTLNELVSEAKAPELIQNWTIVPLQLQGGEGKQTRFSEGNLWE